MNHRKRKSPSSEVLRTSGTVTSIDPQQHDSARVNVSINGIFAFGLHADIVLNHRLVPGVTLSESDIATLLAEDEVRKAITAALNLLSYRPRASGELQQSLRRKGYSADAAIKAVQRMGELGYLNDEEFARRWVENRQQHRPRSRRILTQELRGKGVENDIIADTLASAEIDEFTDALQLAATRAESMRELDVHVRQRRLSGFLARRGYDHDVIRRVLEEIG